MGKLVLTALLFVAGATICLAAGYSYDEDAPNGPSRWGKDCGKGSQTPIDIIPKDTKHENLGAFSFVNYDRALANVEFNVSNANGTTIKYAMPLYKYNVSGGGLPSLYTAVQFHIHWGNNDSKGSEHIVDGSYYPAELHIVHLNTKYQSLTEALGKSDGLAVLGVFIRVGNENTELKSLLDYARNVTSPNEKVTGISSLALDKLLPANKTAFYRYPGSLTTPPCSEAVVWTVFKDHIEISDAQMDLLRGLKLNASTPIGKNYRPIQPLNGRTVIFSSPGGPTPPEDKTTPGSTTTSGSTTTLGSTTTGKGRKLLYSIFSLLLSMLLAGIFLN